MSQLPPHLPLPQALSASYRPRHDSVNDHGHARDRHALKIDQPGAEPTEFRGGQELAMPDMVEEGPLPLVNTDFELEHAVHNLAIADQGGTLAAGATSHLGVPTRSRQLYADHGQRRAVSEPALRSPCERQAEARSTTSEAHIGQVTAPIAVAITERLHEAAQQPYDTPSAAPSEDPLLPNAPCTAPRQTSGIGGKPSVDHDLDGDDVSLPETIDDEQLRAEADERWILNLSMQFRNASRREKLFVTYMPRRNDWRRVTVSWDYAQIRPGSLQEDLSTLVLQRDKCVRIYEAIRLDLPRIVFFPSTTQLRLETEDDDQLHIYVDADQQEAIEYPSVGVANGVECPRYDEGEVFLDQHVSGFVYRVRVRGTLMIKKDIPGPKNVIEFLYEMNCISATKDCASVVNLCGLVTRDGAITALLIDFASRGPLSDILLDARSSSEAGTIPWLRRRKWAGQMIAGLAAIHDAGFVHGDFTLSNIVINDDDDAIIIDMNRSGCPVGWEPPELFKLFINRQRIKMMVGVKSDIFQLGMCLWALAEQVGEPDRRDPGEWLEFESPDVGEWYRAIVRTCLSERPQDRSNMTALLRRFRRGVTGEQRPAGTGSPHAQQQFEGTPLRYDRSAVPDADLSPRGRHSESRRPLPTPDAAAAHQSGRNRSMVSRLSYGRAPDPDDDQAALRPGGNYLAQGDGIRHGEGGAASGAVSPSSQQAESTYMDSFLLQGLGDNERFMIPLVTPEGDGQVP